ncbi:hypothetical protein QTI66_09815 [Variovorax sp. J22R133]|uniref:hypothetical protein n=1 Tax=Variovorax brevis TaxID=3053503 RepID=UPI002577369C|nr:hypothetical protein [Variovorax sp. J22R133]MDM0112447.1 hypothetical protein [Variovorax sp. J22R133]
MAPPPQPQSRLKVEPLEPVPTTQPALKPAPAVPVAAAEDPVKRPAEAGAAPSVAQPPTRSPEEVQQEAQRIRALEDTLTLLRAQAAQTQQLLLEMKSEVAEARASRYRNPLVYALLAILLLALIAMLLLWRAVQRARAPMWWGDDVAPAARSSRKGALPRKGELVDEDDEEDNFEPEAAIGVTKAVPNTISAKPAAAFSTSLVDTDFAALQQSAIAARSAFESAQVRPVNTEELFDVQQQSEFFLSLGQQEQAIEVLREHIATNPGTSALAYLDLFRIFHSLDRREDYARLRREFEQQFNAGVPDFDDFTLEGRSLDRYDGVLERIQATWPYPETLALIEELVFRKPGSREEAFDLPAYQELLLLYAVARDAIEPEGTWAAPATFRSAAATTVPAALEPMAEEVDQDAVDTEGGPLTPLTSTEGRSSRAHAPANSLMHTEPMAHLPVMPHAVRESDAERPKDKPALEMDLSDLDRTDFQTLRAPIEPPAPGKGTPSPSDDPHVIDFDPFDPATRHGPLVIKR